MLPSAPAAAGPEAGGSSSATGETSALVSGICLPDEPARITVSALQLMQVLVALKPHLADCPWSNIRLSGQEGSLALEAVGVKTQVAARVTLAGEGEAGFDIYLPLKDLLGLVQPVKKKEKVTLAEDGKGLKVELGALSTVLSPAVNPDDAPVYPGMAQQSELLADLPLDAAAQEYTLAAMSSDSARPNITALHFEPESEDRPAFLVSTDGHRLHEADLPGALVARPFSPWGPAAELVHRLHKALGDSRAEVRRDGDGVLQVQAPGWEVRCNAEEHTFPDYRRVLPGEDRDEYIAHVEGYFDYFHPAGKPEEDAVLTLALQAWREQRLSVGLVRHVQALCEEDHDIRRSVELTKLAVFRNATGRSAPQRISLLVGKALLLSGARGRATTHRRSWPPGCKCRSGAAPCRSGSGSDRRRSWRRWPASGGSPSRARRGMPRTRSSSRPKQQSIW